MLSGLSAQLVVAAVRTDRPGSCAVEKWSELSVRLVSWGGVRRDCPPSGPRIQSFRDWLSLVAHANTFNGPAEYNRPPALPLSYPTMWRWGQDSNPQPGGSGVLAQVDLAMSDKC